MSQEKQQLQNQVSKLNEEVAAQMHLEFLQHPYARKLLTDLTEQRDKLLNDCMNLSVVSPINTDIINSKLARAKQLTETITHVKTIRPA